MMEIGNVEGREREGNYDGENERETMMEIGNVEGREREANYDGDRECVRARTRGKL